MVDAVRYLEKFTSSDGGTSVTFPGDLYEYESNQDYRQATAAGVGADYAHDYFGSNPWPKAAANENVRFVIWQTTAALVESTYDTLVSSCRRIGMGKLYTLDSDGSRRWAWAKLEARPSWKTDWGQYYNAPVSLRFTRFSDWLGTTQVTGTVTLNSTPKTFTITNPGNEAVKGAAALLLTLRANASAGFTAPQLVNAATNQQINSARNSASVNSRLRIDCEKEAVQYSNDGGSTWTNDYANVTLPAIQQALMTLAPGDNVFTYTDGGTANAFLDYQFYAPYA